MNQRLAFIFIGITVSGLTGCAGDSKSPPQAGAAPQAARPQVTRFQEMKDLFEKAREAINSAAPGYVFERVEATHVQSCGDSVSWQYYFQRQQPFDEAYVEFTPEPNADGTCRFKTDIVREAGLLPPPSIVLLGDEGGLSHVKFDVFKRLELLQSERPGYEWKSFSLMQRLGAEAPVFMIYGQLEGAGWVDDANAAETAE